MNITKYEIFSTITGETLAYTDNDAVFDILIAAFDKLAVPYDWHYTPEWITAEAEANDF